MKKIRMGIVGLGRLGKVHASNIAFHIPDAELVAVCSVIEAEVNEVVSKWNIPYGYTNFEDMIQSAELDAVAIISPSPLHVKQITLALNAGLHVFVDKPLGVTMEECLEAQRIVNENSNKIFMIGFMRRYDPSYAYAKKLIKEGKIGKPFLAKFTSLDPEKYIDGAIKFAPTSGGIFMDMAVHDIDLARWFLDAEVKEVYAIGGSFVHEEFGVFGDCDNACALMKFNNEAMAMFHSGRTAAHGYHVETEIIGEKGSLRIAAEPKKNLCTIYDNTGIVNECSQSFQERFSEAYFLEMKEFVHCIMENRKPDVTVEDGVKGTEVAFAATKAFREKSLVRL